MREEQGIGRSGHRTDPTAGTMGGNPASDPGERRGKGRCGLPRVPGLLAGLSSRLLIGCLFALGAAALTVPARGLAEGRFELRPGAPAAGGSGLPIALQLDDGTQEGAFGLVEGGASRQFLWFNLFEAPPGLSEPFQLEEIHVLFPGGSGFAPGAAVEIVVFRDTDGDPGNGAVLLTSIDATVQAADDATVSIYSLRPPLVVNPPSPVAVGVVNRFVESGVTPPTSPASVDTSAPRGGSWVALWEQDPPSPPQLPPDVLLSRIDEFLPAAAGNWMIRAFGGPLPPAEIPALGAVGLLLMAGLFLLAGRRALGRRRRCGIGLGVAILLALPAQADAPFSSLLEIAAADDANSLAAADLDRDGDIDFVAGSDNRNSVAWYENLGGGTFTKHVLAGSRGTQTVIVLDVDGDGNLDVAAAEVSNNSIAWFRNDGSQNFSRRLVSSSVALPYGVAAADLDRDGDIDFLSAGQINGTVTWHENDGSHAFTDHLISSSANGARSVAAADFDGDGDLDVLSASTFDDKVAWYENDGNQNFTEHPISTSADGANHVMTVDLDRDGDIDALSASLLDDKVAWYENDGSGSFTTHVITRQADGAYNLDVADLDGDGDLDVLSASFNRDGVAWYENDGDQGFTRHVLWESGVFPFTFAVAAGDFDGDGDLDVVSASEEHRRIFWFENLSLHRSALFPAPPSATGLFAFEMLRADLDGDGDLDFLYNHPFGNLPPRWGENAAGDGTVWRSRTIDEPRTANTLAPADIDGDGAPDVVTGAREAVYWYRNEAQDGSSWVRKRISTGRGVAGTVAAGDLDRDGDLDVLVEWSNSQRLYWYENPGDGSEDWQERTVSTDFLALFSLVTVDLDGDGDLDALATAVGRAVIWFENTSGDGTSWTARIIDGVFSEGWKARTADVDRDGDLDVVAAVGGGTLNWYENTAGDGSAWTARPVSGPRPRIRSCRPGDLDGDGDIDIATDEAWYENLDGVGGAWAAHREGRGSDGVDVEVGDFDGDGDLDILDEQSGFRSVYFLENRGGQFALEVPSGGPVRAVSGGTDPLPPVTVAHRGRPEDRDLELTSIALFFDDGAGAPLTTAQLQALATGFSVYLDDGSGTFEAGSDRLLAAVTELPLVDGELSLDLPTGNPDFRIPFGTPKTYFLVAQWTADAHLQPLDGFRIAYRTEHPWTAADPDFGIPLTLEGFLERSVAVEINDPPIAVADSYPMLEDADLVVPAPGVLSNDTDEEGDALSVQLESPPAQAAAFSLAPNGAFTYSPVEHWSGTDAFSYRASDGLELSAVVTVEIPVAAVADPPQLSVAPASSPVGTVPLSIDASLVDGDGSEELAVTVETLPDGASLSAGEDLGGGLWLLAPPELPGLTLQLPPAFGGRLDLTVTARATERSNGDSATTSAVLTVVVGTDLGVSVVESADPVTAGSGLANLVYTVTLTNAGTFDATGIGVRLLPLLPAGTTLDSLEPGTGSVDGGLWTVPSLAGGTAATLQAFLTVGPETPVGTDIVRFEATVESVDQAESMPGDETAAEATSVTREADLRLAVTESVDPVVAGSGAGNLVYRVTLTNAGPSEATGVTVETLLERPPEVRVDRVVLSQGTRSGPDTWVVGDLPAGGVATLDMTLTVGASVPPDGNAVSFSAFVQAVAEADPAPGDEADSATTTILHHTDLSITKDDGLDALPPGGSTTYVLEVRNLGPSDAVRAMVSDEFPPQLTCTWTCDPDPGTACAAGESSGDLLDFAFLPAGTRVVYSARCRLAADAAGAVVNIATVRAGSGAIDPFAGNDTDDDVNQLLAIDWGDAPDSALGPPWAYPTLAADDGAGHGVVDGFHLGESVDAETDGLPSPDADGDDEDASADEDGVSFVQPLIPCEAGTVEVSASAPGLLSGWIDFDRDGTWSEEERVFADEAVAPTRDGAPLELTVVVPCDAAPGATFARFRLSSEAGLLPTGIANDGEVEDHRLEILGVDYGDAPDPTFPTLLARDGARHVLAAGGPLLGSLADAEADGRASASADGDDTDGVDDEDGVAFPSPPIPGQPARVQVTASAAGFLDAWIDFGGDGSWQEEGDRIFQGQPVDPGLNDLTFQVPADAASNLTTYSRFRISSAGVADPTGLAADGEVEDLAVSTAAVADLAVVVEDGSDTAVPGTAITYTITVTNGGPDPVEGAVVTDLFPGELADTSWTCSAAGRGSACTAGPVAGDLVDTVVLQPGGVLTYTATGTLDSGATGTLTNQARVAAPPGTFDPFPDNDVSEDVDTLTPVTDLSLTKDDGQETAVPGETVTYRITATNHGPSDAVGAEVTDLFPPELSAVTWTCEAQAGATCTAGPVDGDLADTVTLPAGTSVTYSAVATVDPGARGTLANIARVTPGPGAVDPEPGNDSDGDTDQLQPAADLAVVLDDGTDSAVPGTRITYQLSVANSGPSDAVAALVELLAAASLSDLEWSCVPSHGSSCTAGPVQGELVDTVTVRAGGTLSYQIAATIDAAALGTLQSTARITAGPDTEDPEPGNDTEGDLDTLTPEVDLELTKTDNVDPLPAGTPLIYTLSVFNRGPSDALGVVVTDLLPPELTPVATSGCAEDPAGAPDCSLGTIPAGASATYTLEVSVAPSPPAQVVNRASVTGTHPETDPEDNADDESTGLDAVAPEVTAIEVEDGAPILACSSLGGAVRAIRITFSEAMVAAGGAQGSVTDPDAYRLVLAPAGRAFDTETCAGGTGQDRVVPLDEITYDAAEHRATLHLLRGATGDGLHRLLVCGSVTDLAGNPLDGGEGTGSDRAATFRVDRFNLLAGAHFDTFDPACGLDAWQSSDPDQLELSAQDREGSPLSGSAHGLDPLQGMDLAQCVPLPGPGALEVRAALRTETATASVVGASLEVAFFAGPLCDGALLDRRLAATALVGPTSGYFPMRTEATPPAGAASVRYRVVLESPLGEAFDGYIDGAFLGNRILFEDSFESGDTSAWSATVP